MKWKDEAEKVYASHKNEGDKNFNTSAEFVVMLKPDTIICPICGDDLGTLKEYDEGETIEFICDTCDDIYIWKADQPFILNCKEEGGDFSINI